MVYFTADLHFGHTNVIRYDNRPFASAEEMDAELMHRWNAKVQPKDTVYILGDFCWYHSDKACEILKNLNGHKILIMGNHDNRWLNGASRRFFDGVYDYHELKINDTKVILSHYPIPFYNRQHYGAYMLYGHVHNSYEWNMIESYKREMQQLGIRSKMYNVGCMIWNYEPVSLEEITADQRFQPVHVEGVD